MIIKWNNYLSHFNLLIPVDMISYFLKLNLFYSESHAAMTMSFKIKTCLILGNIMNGFTCVINPLHIFDHASIPNLFGIFLVVAH